MREAEATESLKIGFMIFLGGSKFIFTFWANMCQNGLKVRFSSLIKIDASIFSDVLHVVTVP